MRYRISRGMIVAMALLALVACDKDMWHITPTAPKPAPKLTTYAIPDSTRQTAALNHATDSRTITPPQAAGATVAADVATGPGPVVKVGLLLPLTGRNAQLGKALQDAATLSLFDKYGQLSSQQAATKVILLPKDTGDTPEQAVVAMRAAIADGAAFIIGPLFADATQAGALAAQTKNISVLSLSNAADHAGNGIYMYGFSPQDQTARIINFALSAGKSRIAVMAPDSPLGNAVLDAARATMSAKGLTLAKEVQYSAEGTGIDTAANQLVPSPGRPPDFDALLLPEGGAPLPIILRALEARGINAANVQFLGTGIWDDAALVRRVSLEGAWLASSPPKATAAFDARFRSTYQYVPPRIASLAYDAVAFAVTLGTSGRGFDTATLTSHAGFIGPANGLFRLQPSGKVERGLAVLQVEAGTFREISPPPSGFAGQ